MRGGEAESKSAGKDKEAPPMEGWGETGDLMIRDI